MHIPYVYSEAHSHLPSYVSHFHTQRKFSEPKSHICKMKLTCEFLKSCLKRSPDIYSTYRYFFYNATVQRHIYFTSRSSFTLTHPIPTHPSIEIMLMGTRICRYILNDIKLISLSVIFGKINLSISKKISFSL